jgi:hypothetical protein
MEVGDGQNRFGSLGNPSFLGQILAFRAMPVSAAVVTGFFLETAIGAEIHMPA